MYPRTTLQNKTQHRLLLHAKDQLLFLGKLLTSSLIILNSTIYSFTSQAEPQTSTYFSTSASPGNSPKIQTSEWNSTLSYTPQQNACDILSLHLSLHAENREERR